MGSSWRLAPLVALIAVALCAPARAGSAVDLSHASAMILTAPLDNEGETLEVFAVQQAGVWSSDTGPLAAGPAFAVCIRRLPLAEDVCTTDPTSGQLIVKPWGLGESVLHVEMTSPTGIHVEATIVAATKTWSQPFVSPPSWSTEAGATLEVVEGDTMSALAVAGYVVWDGEELAVLPGGDGVVSTSVVGRASLSV